ncbi:MAG: 50S ribosomal protein L6 [Patescibacteria group bacterium]
MSRVGKKPILIPAGVQVTIESNTITAKGPKGELKMVVHPKVSFKVDNNELIFSVANENNREQAALWGTMRAIASNIIEGVSQGFNSQLELNGVGYKVALAGNKLNFALGFSHPVEVAIPNGIQVTVDKNLITGQSADKQMLGQFMADIFRLKPHEPYKGKGFKVPGKFYRRLAGKSGKAKK